MRRAGDQGLLKLILRRTSIRDFVILFAIVISGIAAVRAYNTATDMHRESTRTLNALCTFRGDLVQRVNSSRAFLKTHPQGFAGITAATIKNGLDNQQRTIDALANLPCAMR